MGSAAKCCPCHLELVTVHHRGGRGYKVPSLDWQLMAPEEVRIAIFEGWEMVGFLCSSGQLHIHVFMGSTE